MHSFKSSRKMRIVPQLYHMQHGFLKGGSTITQLLAVYQEIVEALAKGKETDVITWTSVKLSIKYLTTFSLENYPG